MKVDVKTLGLKATQGIVALYLGLVAYLTLFDSLDAFVTLPAFVGAFYCLLSGLRIAAGRLTLRQPETRCGFSWGLFLAVFAIVFSGQMLYWAAYYPGGFNLDAYGQWDQVHGLQALNNWHPVFTTLLYWMLTQVCDSFAFCIFSQLLAFSLSTSYFLAVLREADVSKILLLIAAVYIGANLAIGLNNVCLFKDVPFAIALIWLNIALVRTVATNGEWLSSAAHACWLALALLAVMLIRHNGIFYTAPVVVLLCGVFAAYRKRVLVASCACILLFVAIEGPLFSALSVEKHDNPVGEMVGLPMSVMANNLVSDPESVPDEVRSFLQSVASEQEWRDNYELGEWDSCKWIFGEGELFKDAPLGNVIELSLTSALASPDSAYRSLRENTRVVWQVAGNVDWGTWVYIEDNDYGIEPRPNELAAQVVGVILGFSFSPVGAVLCWNVGVANVAFILLGFLCVAKRDSKPLILVVAPVAYNLLTMLLLCGPSHRYFYYASVIVVPIALFCFRGVVFADVGITHERDTA